jgi:hypothetical protein
MARVRLISATPSLLAAVHQIHAGAQYELAAALAEGEAPDLTAQLMAGQVTATITTLQEVFFRRLASGTPLEEAGRQLADDVELGFDLLEYGFSSTREEKS